MCGIAGIVAFNGVVESEKLKAMTDIIVHRGPDGEGQWLNGAHNVGFGHRRLSIIDLSENGKQPMHYANGRYTITFNGEIYNYIELREKLKHRGYRFVSGSDTEVLLAMYDLKKETCLEDLDGMFAFAIWDEREQTLFCARDRFGEKPFHYYIDKHQFVFASEIKQFWAYGISKKTTEKRLRAFINNGEVDDSNEEESTFYETIKRLDAATYMVVTKDKKPVKQKYWSVEVEQSFKGNLRSASDQFLELLTDSVKMRLRSDVPVGSSLSGGLDSSSIVMLIDRLKGESVIQNTFSARFKNFAKDEGKYIEEVVKACCAINAQYTWPDEDYFLSVFDQVTYHQDEPYGSGSIVAQYAVMQLAKERNVTVLLDGQGADEYLAGYHSQYYTYLGQLFYNDRKKYNREYGSYSNLQNLNQPIEDFRSKESLRQQLGRHKRLLLGQSMPVPANALALKLKFDLQTDGLKTLLRYADRNSMAHSREVRLPFLSHKLVEFVFSLPDDFKLKEGWSKYVLRNSMQGILPRDICWRTDKIGFEPPQNNWMNSGKVNALVEKTAKELKLDYVQIPNDARAISKKWRLLMASKYLHN